MSNGWIDGLPPHAREVLRSADEDHPSPERVARLGSALTASLAAAVASTGSAALASGATASATAASATVASGGVTSILALVGKVIGAGLVLVTATTAAIHWAPREDATAREEAVRVPPRGDPASSSPMRFEAAVDTEAIEVPEPGSASAVPTQDPPVEAPVEGDRPRAVLPSRAAPAAAAPSVTHAEASPEPPSELRVELALLMRLRSSALTDPALALRLADEHASRFGESTFAPEREFFRINALVALGRRGEARRQATQFASRHTGSPYAARVQSLVDSLDP